MRATPQLSATAQPSRGSPYGRWLTLAVLGACGAALVALLWAFVAYRSARTRAAEVQHVPPPPVRMATTSPAPPRDATPPVASAPPTRTRSAIVRTDLHPQGYVEMDRCLYRAVWAAPGAPPRPGSPVVIAPGSATSGPDVLLAFPPSAQGSPHD